MPTVFVLAVIGFALSVYSLFIEWRILRDSSYKPLCDISSRVSCSKPLLSPYSKLFIVSNSVVGMLYYATVFALVWFNQNFLLVIVCSLAVAMSIIFAYFLYFRVRALCILCTALYVINFLLLWMVYSR